MASVIFTTISATAATAPIFNTLRKIETAVGAMVSGKGSAPFQTSLDSAMVHKVVLNSAETVAEVTIGNTSCLVEIIKVASQPGLLGSQQYKGEVDGASCGVIRENLQTMSFLKVKALLLKSANKKPALGLNFEVVSKTKIKIGKVTANDSSRLK